MTPIVYYFGCLGTPGHYLYHPTGKEMRMRDLTTPWGNHIDGGASRKDSPHKEAVGVLHCAQVEDWTTIAFADRSVDRRGGSHSTFLVNQPMTSVELIRLARIQWPQVFSRPNFPTIIHPDGTPV